MMEETKASCSSIIYTRKRWMPRVGQGQMGRRERVDWRNRKKGLFNGKSITQSKLSHFEANTMPLLSCLHVQRAQFLLLQGFFSLGCCAHTVGVQTLLKRALVICEWIQLISTDLDFPAVQLDLWEMSGLIPRMFNKTQKREAARTKTPNLSPNHAK